MASGEVGKNALNHVGTDFLFSLSSARIDLGIKKIRSGSYQSPLTVGFVLLFKVKELVKLSSEVAWEWGWVRWSRERDVDRQVSTVRKDVLADCLGN